MSQWQQANGGNLSPVPRVAYAGREAGSGCHRGVIWKCRLSVKLEYMGIPGVDGIYLPCGSYHLGDDGVFRIVFDGAVFRQAVGTVRFAARGAARGAGRGEARRWAVRKTGRPPLSNRPVSCMVDHAGIQPATSGVQSRCSRD